MRKSRIEYKCVDESSDIDIDDYNDTNELSINYKLLALFNKLDKISSSQITQTVSNTLATGHGINLALQECIGDIAYIIPPDSSSISSPAANDDANQYEGAVNYAKMIGGYSIDGNKINNGLIEEGKLLTNPIVMIINTMSVKARSATDTTAEGGLHWHCCVVLPKRYITPDGVQLDNDNEIIFYLDSLYPKVMIQPAFINTLRSGLKYTFSSDGVKYTHELPALFPNAEVIDGLTTNQQEGGSDCGWWALYNALMLVLTGNHGFLEQFTKPSREPAYKLRAIFPSLATQIDVPTATATSSTTKKQKMSEDYKEGISKAEFLAIQKAIEESLKDANNLPPNIDSTHRKPYYSRVWQPRTEFTLKSDTFDLNPNSGHLQHLRFINASKFSAPSLEGAKEWMDIPNFAVITGRNGVGKSHLLKFIEQSLNPLAEHIQVVYRDTGFSDYSGRSANYSNDGNYYIEEQQKRTLLASIKQYYDNGRTLLPNQKPNDILYRVVERLEKNANTFDPTNTNDSQWEQIVSEEIFKDVNYNSNSERCNPTRPLDVLVGVFKRYDDLKQARRVKCKELSFAATLFKFYCKRDQLDIENSEHYKQFMTQIIGGEALDLLIEGYLQEIMGVAPCEQINKVLEQFNFTYRLQWKPFKSQTEELSLVRHKQTSNGVTITPIRTNDLSSGEKMILDLMAWKFFNQGCSADGEIRRINSRIDIMILDEPDRHLDAKMCEQFFRVIYESFAMEEGIQVFMTTHRTDTIALAPKGKIFLMERDENDKAKLVPCDKLRAMFRLTHNLRELTNFHIKVYVEAFDDASFYEAVYQSLMSYCNKVRKNDNLIMYATANHEPRLHWRLLKPQAQKVVSDSSSLTLEPQESTTIWRNRVLSRRYQFAFHSTAMTKKAGSGGSAGVKNAVTRDFYALKHLSKTLATKPSNFRRPLIEPDLELPFGILDKDYNKLNDKAIKEANLADRIMIGERHSVENYIFDPFIIFSVLNISEIEKFTNQNFRDICILCKKFIIQLRRGEANCAIESQSNPINGFFRFLISELLNTKELEVKFRICEILLPELPKLELFRIIKGKLDLPDYYVKSFLKTFSIPDNEKKTYDEFSRKDSTLASLDKANNNFELVINACQHLNPSEKIDKDNIVDKLLNYNRKVTVILSDKQLIALDYPLIFLFIQGHTLEDIIEKQYQQDIQSEAVPTLEDSKPTCKSAILKKIGEQVNIIIPTDLAEIFFKLNAAVRKQCNGVIKPNLETELSEKLMSASL